MDNTQLPADVLEKIHTDTNLLYDQLDEAAREVDYYDFGLPQSDRQTEPIRNLLTEYATKLHQEQQTTKVLEYDNNRLQGEVEGCKVAVEELKEWKQQAIELLDPLFEYGHSKEAGITLGKSITAVVLERCKRSEQARTLLQTVYDLKLMPSTAPIIEQIKTFLDGK